MKKTFIFTLLLFCFALPAFAQAPCPNDKGDAKPVDPNEKCKTKLGDTDPVLFVFPDDKKANDDKKPEEKPVANPTVPPKANSARQAPTTCTYSAYAWDTKKKRSTDHFDVSKSYAEVTDEERDPNAPQCTICREDQVVIDPHEFGVSADTIRICHLYADQVKNALIAIHKSGEFDIEKLEGYRPGKTRGAVDKNGLRTQWSQHSFGTAIDINAHKNAIYSNCTTPINNSAQDVKSCKKGIGGAYNPEKQPRVSIVKGGVVYREMTKFWKWGGEIEGSTKDIMHFSVTGY